MDLGDPSTSTMALVVGILSQEMFSSTSLEVVIKQCAFLFNVVAAT